MRCALLLLLMASPEWTEEEVLRKVYDPKAVVPEDFFLDPITAPGRRFYWHRSEWVTDDAAEARRWVEEHLARSSIPEEEKEIVESTVTKRGFDFKAGQMWFRIHRRAWFAWKGSWVGDDQRLGRDGAPHDLGTLGARPLTAKEVREFAEYDWWIRNRNATGHKVLASKGEETERTFVRTLETTTLVRGDWGVADTVLRWRITYAVDRRTGRTTKAVLLVATIAGRRD